MLPRAPNHPFPEDHLGPSSSRAVGGDTDSSSEIVGVLVFGIDKARCLRIENDRIVTVTQAGDPDCRRDARVLELAAATRCRV